MKPVLSNALYTNDERKSEVTRELKQMKRDRGEMDYMVYDEYRVLARISRSNWSNVHYLWNYVTYWTATKMEY